MRLLVTLAVPDGASPENTRDNAGQVLRSFGNTHDWAVTGVALAPVQAPAGSCCAGCGHLVRLHERGGCTGKVYPSHSLTGEPCPCEARPEPAT